MLACALAANVIAPVALVQNYDRSRRFVWIFFKIYGQHQSPANTYTGSSNSTRVFCLWLDRPFFCRSLREIDCPAKFTKNSLLIAVQLAHFSNTINTINQSNTNVPLSLIMNVIDVRDRSDNRPAASATVPTIKFCLFELNRNQTAQIFFGQCMLINFTIPSCPRFPFLALTAYRSR